MTLDESHLTANSDQRAGAFLSDGLYKEGGAVHERVPKLKDAAGGDIQLVCFKNSMEDETPKGIDIRLVREVARLESNWGVAERRKFAIQILEEASQMEEVIDRKNELSKLKTLFRLSKDKRDKHTWASLASLVAASDLSQKDCKIALRKLATPK